MNPLELSPEAPHWRLDWDATLQALPQLEALRDCPQDPHWHGEGDVLTHTRMVLQALCDMSAWRALPAVPRRELFLAAALHDLGKPGCTRQEGERILSRGHGRRGAQQVRILLWRLGLEPAARERITALVRYHDAPFVLLERPDSQRAAITIAQTARCRLLGLLAQADTRGRICHDRAELLERIELFAQYCRELGCLDGPYPFPSDHSRFLYFRKPKRPPMVEAWDDCRCQVSLLSGLPGAGKDHWLACEGAHLPVVSLDALRRQLGAAPTGKQGAVVQAARQRARELLREGQDFAWNATSLSRDMRQRCIDLFADYRARVRIVYVEVPWERLLVQNKQRRDALPQAAIERLLRRWQVPDLREAHEVLWV